MSELQRQQIKSMLSKIAGDPNVHPEFAESAGKELRRLTVQDEPHASDCAIWCDEPCDCMMSSPDWDDCFEG